MKSPVIFPIILFCNHRFGYPESPALAQTVWTRLKRENTPVPVKKYFNETELIGAKGITWYAVDGVLKSDDVFTIRVYDMADSVYSGIGERFIETDVKLKTENEFAAAKKLIDERKFEIAESELERREKEKWLRAVAKVQKELFPE